MSWCDAAVVPAVQAVVAERVGVVDLDEQRPAVRRDRPVERAGHRLALEGLDRGADRRRIGEPQRVALVVGHVEDLAAEHDRAPLARDGDDLLHQDRLGVGHVGRRDEVLEGGHDDTDEALRGVRLHVEGQPRALDRTVAQRPVDDRPDLAQRGVPHAATGERPQRQRQVRHARDRPAGAREDGVDRADAADDDRVLGLVPQVGVEPPGLEVGHREGHRLRAAGLEPVLRERRGVGRHRRRRLAEQPHLHRRLLAWRATA